MWGVIEYRAKLAGHSPRTLRRACGSVAETFKVTGGEGRWLWRLVGDTRNWSQGDVDDMLGGNPAGRRASGGVPLRFGTATGSESALGLEDLDGDDDDDLDEDEDEADET